jgi:hypothetical protein
VLLALGVEAQHRPGSRRQRDRHHHARTIRAGHILTPERQGRYWVAVPRAWNQWGKPEACYRALLAAERAAPAEVRYRPPVHRMTEDLLRLDASSSMAGLRDFARRVFAVMQAG